jgi:hypothetical protein
MEEKEEKHYYSGAIVRAFFLKHEMVSQLSPLWPTLFAIAGILLLLREAVRIRKHPERSATSRLFLLLAASLFTVTGFADLIIRLVITGRW